MEYIKEIYDRLIKGKFITSDSIDENQKNWFNAIENNYEGYLNYYKQIGFTLEMEDGYCYFSRDENVTDYERKLSKFRDWIKYLDLLKSFNVSFGRGFTFKRFELEQSIQSNIELGNKALALFDKCNSIEKAVDGIIKELIDADFLECVNEVDGDYKVTAAFGYIERVINSITIEKSVEDEIPE